ncbi:hypothetical protein ACFVTX_12060 [Agromyces sp. NPDC058136]|uniref:hypothetical protein n=1 Tax=Agromyces sp. NPDC058136 TaxID=3346354 RepID=UPI0036D9974B
MSDTPEQPETPDATTPEEAPVFETAATRDEVRVKRSPRYGAFMIAGAVVGAIVAFVLSFAFAPTDAQIAERLQSDFTYSQGQVFGFLLLGGVALGVALGAVVALIVDRVLAGRAKSFTAEHESTHRIAE